MNQMPLNPSNQTNQSKNPAGGNSSGPVSAGPNAGSVQSRKESDRPQSAMPRKAADDHPVKEVNYKLPPEGAFNPEPRPIKNVDTRPGSFAPTPPAMPANRPPAAKKPDKKFRAPSGAIPPTLPFASGDESNKSFKVMMAGTIILLTAILIIAVFAFKKNGASPVPANSPAVSSTPTPTVDPNLDSDRDGLPDRIEAIIGTNPNNADTDGDTYTDLNEIKNGYSPLIAGPVGKYTPEQWQAVKDKIKSADREFYEKIFNIIPAQ